MDPNGLSSTSYSCPWIVRVHGSSKIRTCAESGTESDENREEADNACSEGKPIHETLLATPLLATLSKTDAARSGIRSRNLCAEPLLAVSIRKKDTLALDHQMTNRSAHLFHSAGCRRAAAVQG